MKKYLALLVGVLLLTLNAHAQSFFTPGFKAAWPAAEKPKSEEYQLDHAEFLTRYGVSDTARAIINMYYKKRGSALLTIQIAAVVSAAAGAVAGATSSPSSSSSSNPNMPSSSRDVEYAGWVYPAVGVPFSAMVFGLAKMGAWNRLQLYQNLRQYHEKRVLPTKIRHRLTDYLARTQAGEF